MVLLATKYVWLAAARSAVSISSRLAFWVCRQRLCDGAQRLTVGVAERGLDIEQGRFRVCRQHLCDNGGDGADIAGAVGKQHGVTVLEGKWQVRIQSSKCRALNSMLSSLGRSSYRRGANPIIHCQQSRYIGPKTRMGWRVKTSIGHFGGAFRLLAYTRRTIRRRRSSIAIPPDI